MTEVVAVALAGRGELNLSEKGEKTDTNELEALNGARTAAMLVRNHGVCNLAVNRQCKAENGAACSRLAVGSGCRRVYAGLLLSARQTPRTRGRARGCDGGRKQVTKVVVIRAWWGRSCSARY